MPSLHLFLYPIPSPPSTLILIHLFLWTQTLPLFLLPLFSPSQHHLTSPFLPGFHSHFFSLEILGSYISATLHFPHEPRIQQRPCPEPQRTTLVLHPSYTLDPGPAFSWPRVGPATGPSPWVSVTPPGNLSFEGFGSLSGNNGRPKVSGANSRGEFAVGGIFTTAPPS